MQNDKLRKELKDFLEINIHNGNVEYEIISTHKEEHYERQLIKYLGSENDEIKAYLFIPTNKKIIGALLVHHQHNGERHLGKSEVAGITGDPFQFFCPALAKKGIVTLAPDSISFEDRRTNKKGYLPAEDPDDDILQHYNEMCYRLLRGKTLMKKVIEDSSIGISLLSQLHKELKNKIGILGHSYGGNTVLFHSPFDDRIKYSCSSGAVCNYKTKFKFGTGIEMAEVIPGFAEKYDIEDLIKCISPRKILFLSATEDKYSQDAKNIYENAKPVFANMNAENSIIHKEYKGGHALNVDRFNFIIKWFKGEFK